MALGFGVLVKLCGCIARAAANRSLARANLAGLIGEVGDWEVKKYLNIGDDCLC